MSICIAHSHARTSVNTMETGLRIFKGRGRSVSSLCTLDFDMSTQTCEVNSETFSLLETFC